MNDVIGIGNLLVTVKGNAKEVAGLVTADIQDPGSREFCIRQQFSSAGKVYGEIYLWGKLVATYQVTEETEKLAPKERRFLVREKISQKVIDVSHDELVEALNQHIDCLL